MKLLIETLPCVKSLYHLLCLSVHVCILCLTLLKYKQHKSKDTVSHGHHCTSSSWHSHRYTAGP